MNAPTSRLSLVDASAPPERLAALRIVIGVFALTYLLIRLPVFAQLARRTEGFDGVGVFVVSDGPLPVAAIQVLITSAIGTGVAFAIGWRFRVSGPAFAVVMLVLTSYRSSWGQLLHFENLMVLYLLIVGLAPSADAWSLDARLRTSRGTTRAVRSPVSYGWPIRLACLTLVLTYVIAGIAKLRYGGVDWMVGDTLRNHIAYSAVRLDLLGADAAPFARVAVEHAWLLPPMAVGSVAIELAAPLALLGGRLRTGWVIAAWLMHFTIFATMLVGFPAPLFLVAFAPLFALEQLVDRARRRRSTFRA